ncbi:MAG: hypothetical protein HY850_09160 [Betaproteobacteria bacterium]|nr:hypothetical protein [Betaproteobacteria bacterium]
MKKLLIATLFFIAAPAFAQYDPIAQFKAAMAEYPKSGNQFAGYSLSCINLFVVGKSGIYAPSSQRQCVSYMLTKAVADQLVGELKWTHVYRTKAMDMVQAGAATSSGITYMLIHYDKSGNASEFTLFNDTLP